MFFFIFNVTNAHSLCYVVTDNKLKLNRAIRIQKKQREITLSIQELYNMQSMCDEPSKKMRIRAETSRPELVMLSNEYNKRMEKEIKESRQITLAAGTGIKANKVRMYMRNIAIFGVVVGLAA